MILCFTLKTSSTKGLVAYRLVCSEILALTVEALGSIPALGLDSLLEILITSLLNLFSIVLIKCIQSMIKNNGSIS